MNDCDYCCENTPTVIYLSTSEALCADCFKEMTTNQEKRDLLENWLVTLNCYQQIDDSELNEFDSLLDQLFGTDRENN